ncbi:MAG: SRPBCC family protein [Caulobacteraceae bacterium]
MTETRSQETRSVVLERDMPHPPEKVWRALTAQPLIEDWLMANDFEAKVGHEFTLRAQAVGGWNGIIDCKVLAVEPPQRLSYSWASMGLQSVVTFTVTPTASGARLRMEQSGFPADATQNIRGAEYGWNNFLDRLVPVVARA